MGKQTIKYTECKIIELYDWDELVQNTYNKPYSFQQQDDCKERGLYYFTVSHNGLCDYDYENDTVPEIVNDDKMGVSFKAWLERDPNTKISTDSTTMWWERNFYPHVSTIINDLYHKGLLEEGQYGINIDW